MSSTRRQYSPQFKLQIVLELLKGEQSAAQIAREHGLGYDLLSRWKDLFHDRSPIFFVDQIKAPLLLLAGGNDPRCPKEEAQQVVDAVKKRGGVAEYKVYENEGHGFARVENQIDAYQRVADFLKAHVPPADCGCSLNE